MEGKKLVPWALSLSAVFERYKSKQSGLTSKEATLRQASGGLNALPKEEKEPGFVSFIKTFLDPLTAILIVAAIVSALAGLFEHNPENINNAFLLLGIVIFMAVVSFATDRQADQALSKLKDLQKSYARVYRDGKLVEIESENLVAGDVVSLKEGDKVPTDGRIVECDRGEVNEMLLTGESSPVTKTVGILKASCHLSERTNMVFAGSHLESGNLIYVVTSIGTHTELGKIWQEIQNTDVSETPLQAQLNKLGNMLMAGTLVVCVAIVGIYIYRGQPILEALVLAVALAIAFIPEALGAVITISLALGVREMVKHNAIIKRLRAAEGLGSVSIVCTDKTGTITFGKMTATHIWTAEGGSREVNGDHFAQGSDIDRLVRVAHLCNDLGSPTEKALGELASRAGFEITADSRRTRVHELAFNSDRKMMTVVHNLESEPELSVLVKGAPDRLIDLSTHYLKGNKKMRLDVSVHKKILEAINKYEQKGYRVLAFADRELPYEYDTKRIEERLTFVGLVAISDPVRPEVRGTVDKMKRAGISAVMITGDSPITALAIAKDAGIVPEHAIDNDVLMGIDIDEMTKNGVNKISARDMERVVKTRVFARTSPNNKISIVKIFQRAGKLVAMSGDGVNDAPSLKQADVGIAMSNGTEITKEIADVILTGSYRAIAEAVEVGRTILHRTRLYTHALLSTNGAEVMLFVVAVALDWPAPLTAVQLLLINVLGDAWLSIALATEKADKDIMLLAPRKKTDNIITRYMYISIGVQSVVTTAILTIVFLVSREYAIVLGLSNEATLILQQSAVFSTFMVQKILRSSFTARSLKFNLWQIGIFSNRWSVLAALATVVLAFMGLYVPVFGMAPIPVSLMPLLLLGLIPPAVEEAIKFARSTN